MRPQINKKNMLLWIAAILMVILGLPSAGRSGEPNWPETLTIGTASPGGTYYQYGEGLARLLSRKLGLPVIARPTEAPQKTSSCSKVARSNWHLSPWASHSRDGMALEIGPPAGNSALRGPCSRCTTHRSSSL